MSLVGSANSVWIFPLQLEEEAKRMPPNAKKEQFAQCFCMLKLSTCCHEQQGENVLNISGSP
jgi:hypothetical protein